MEEVIWALRIILRAIAAVFSGMASGVLLSTRHKLAIACGLLVAERGAFSLFQIYFLVNGSYECCRVLCMVDYVLIADAAITAVMSVIIYLIMASIKEV